MFRETWISKQGTEALAHGADSAMHEHRRAFSGSLGDRQYFFVVSLRILDVRHNWLYV